MPAPDKVRQLVETFEQNLNEYRTHKNETELRRQFLDPFFEALGWDVGNAKGYDERHKEVAHELSVEIDGQQKKADYAFRTGVDKFDFLVEAKKPSVKIESNPAPAFQVRRYGWSAKLPISILTDFEHFAVYDCRAKPSHKDKVSTGRILLAHYKDYVEKWDEIAALFSPDAIRKGALDKFSEGTKGRKGTADVDDDFLAEIERWRELLARNIALRNRDKGLTEAELNYAVQMTIDRIVFLRIAEERGMEEYGRLKNLCDYEDIYTLLKQYFLKADERYNSGLFHFKAEKERRNPDTVTPNLEIDDRVLRDIIENLYEPKSPYAFAYIPADILGSVYERFLGKVIRLTAGGQAKVEDKPEVRKAGGVYYTPTYIVEYIVKNTVGRLMEGDPSPSPSTLTGTRPERRGESLTPKEVSELKIVDPACGSGSFLLGAYQHLLNWHLDWYVQNDLEKALKRKVILTQDNKTFRLSMDEKKRILLNNIRGVDVDPQAVEVTKLSLLLKVVEDPGQLKMFEEGHILPDLGNNIKCGNSLIGMDYFDGQLLADADELKRVNPFDWKSAFPDVFKHGGFDAVIGNPPYVFTRNEGIDSEQKDYFYSKYAYQSVQLNTFGMFLEQSHRLLKLGGQLGYITPNNWLTIDTFSNLRKFICGSTKDLRIINILDKVFVGANVDTAITLFEKGTSSILAVAEMKGQITSSFYYIDLSLVKPPAFIIQINLLKDTPGQSVIRRIEIDSKKLSDFATVSTGLKAYQIGKGRPVQTKREKENRIFHAGTKKDNTFDKYLNGVDVNRYLIAWSGEYLSYGDWLAEPRKSVPFVGDRILVRQIPSKPPYLLHAAFTSDSFYNDINSMVVFEPQGNISLKYLLGLLNSRLLSFWFMKTFDKLQRKIFPQFKVKELASFPIRPINFADPAERAKHDQMVTRVERMLALHKTLASAKTPQERESVQGQIRSTDEAIDRLVYELYGLSPEEINIVEGKR